jgi:hypothetical protein
MDRLDRVCNTVGVLGREAFQEPSKLRSQGIGVTRPDPPHQPIMLPIPSAVSASKTSLADTA